MEFLLGTPVEPLARRALAALTPNNRNLQYDVQTFDVMRRALRRDSNWIDIGCHTGSMLREMMKLAPAGQHLAFEPLPDLFAELQRSFSVPGVKLCNVALSDAAGTTTFQWWSPVRTTIS